MHLRIQHFQAAAVRHASTSTSHYQQYPFPTHKHATPHQIFHLPQGASQRDIKARYFDLVKVYHPDSPNTRNLPHTTRHAQFRAVTDAYDVLRGKARASLRQKGDDWNDSVYAELERRRQRSQPFTHPHTHGKHGKRGWGAAEFPHDFPEASTTFAKDKGDEQWKDMIIMCAAVVVRLPPLLCSPSSYSHVTGNRSRHITGYNTHLPSADRKST
ncbi:hypothetical protein BC835DRAFT_1279996 [Cytidiella melzeri]|nr:hypothetical protein BC835DRAFT_1279996 [Cytidiella melzeri]